MKYTTEIAKRLKIHRSTVEAFEEGGDSAHAGAIIMVRQELIKEEISKLDELIQRFQTRTHIENRGGRRQAANQT